MAMSTTSLENSGGEAGNHQQRLLIRNMLLHQAGAGANVDRRKVRKSVGAGWNVVGLICPPSCYRVNCSAKDSPDPPGPPGSDRHVNSACLFCITPLAPTVLPTVVIFYEQDKRNGDVR